MNGWVMLVVLVVGTLVALRAGRERGSRSFGPRWVLFWDCTQSPWAFGKVGPDPFQPYEWKLFVGWLCLCRVTENKPRRLSRQERRKLTRDLEKSARRTARLLGEDWQ